jgi:alpha-beta hydrolase superfamily lysophospholipase
MASQTHATVRQAPYTVFAPEGEAEPVQLMAEDGVPSPAIYYRPRGTTPKTVVHLMHPRGDFSRHYAVPGLLQAGYGVLCQNSRYGVNYDVFTMHERLLLDVAAGVRYVKQIRQVQQVVQLGNSGGGSLFGFYQAQAHTPPPGRLTHTPAGDALDLNTYELPPVEGFITLAAHRGQGKVLMGCLDPSVIDEHDPLSVDATLDMYDPTNGYRPFPESSTYDAAFLTRYRAAQEQRVARLDALARYYLRDQEAHRCQLETMDARVDPTRRMFSERRAHVGRIMIIYRTLANPAFCDLSLHPSDRELGSIFHPQPERGNYAAQGLARLQTPEAWLSTWSGLSSQASLVDNIARCQVPTLVLQASADCDIYYADARAIFEAAAATDKMLVTIEGATHWLMPRRGWEGEHPRARLQRILQDWLGDRFPR